MNKTILAIAIASTFTVANATSYDFGIVSDGTYITNHFQQVAEADITVAKHRELIQQEQDKIITLNHEVETLNNRIKGLISLSNNVSSSNTKLIKLNDILDSEINTISGDLKTQNTKLRATELMLKESVGINNSLNTNIDKLNTQVLTAQKLIDEIINQNKVTAQIIEETSDTTKTVDKAELPSYTGNEDMEGGNTYKFRDAPTYIVLHSDEEISVESDSEK